MTTSTPTPAYYIRSSRDPSRFYLVAENSRGFLECDCPAATFYRSRPCKHVEQIRRGGGLAAQPKSAIAPAPDLGDEANDYGMRSPEYRSDFGFIAPDDRSW